MSAETPASESDLEVSVAAGLVRLEVAGQVATVTLDSPGNRNALSRQLVAELSQHLAAIDDRADVRLAVLTHTGGTFCAGADMAEALAEGMEQGSRRLLDVLRQIVGLRKPVLAVVDGHVRAGGLGLVGACDLAAVSSTSTFAFTESRLGLTPAVISTTTRDRMSDRVAAHRYLSGAPFDGAEAARIGLVTVAVASDALQSEVETLQGDLLKASPQGLRETKALLNASLIRRIDEEGPELVALSARLFGSDEAREGMAAFKERRPPSWAQPPD